MGSRADLRAVRSRGVGQAVSPPRQIQRSLSRRRARDLPLFEAPRHQVLHVQPYRGDFLAGGELHKRIKNGSYGNGEYFAVMELLDPVIEKYGLMLRECALRRLAHHSLLGEEKGNAVLIGASSVAHLESNLVGLEKGPLPDEVVGALDKGWERAKGLGWEYWF
ncbi:uncharacterized protein K441DRAFT_662032 [Cenococcum geophilum 1.58]|uniref:uncharacterized protein n=1 Tax=Cenococcum geophilum 1.58 TaxID=794803 RepID=UPI00358F2163|nr:hypothetical protein K441DRAFT_662032 [Cenococcum geophilum 1.58]